ncbi:DUF3159 domain-containing protein [Rhodococcus spongiicola]|uniref:DUF3159 domain-containing protein n=1 Tax=Rhodococcus spongiicola TaxID=2487352 RepID=A0A3S3CQV4_9NOCA|nr:DUF3159 domain-containing protein [Rhodococcus spongiicola]RVW03498.1 DUF3159 domain-containing protein [Rhodococcus spongiicola]
MTETKQQTILDQLGGLSGLVYSTLPIVAFVPANSIWGLVAAIWIALGVATGILLWRIVRRGPIQPAVSGFLGVGVCAFIAYQTGDAKGYFLFGIYTSLVYAGAFVASILVRRPLVGVVWGYLNGHGNAWRAHPVAVRAYDVATAAWALVFGARYFVQSELYDADQTGWLAVARIGMGWPLTGLALLVTIWAVRRADRIVEPAPEPADLETAPSAAAGKETDVARESGQEEAGEGSAPSRRTDSDVDRGA